MAIAPPHEIHDHHCLVFPPHFLWGAATSAHQVEGDNKNSDWWRWEHSLPAERRSGKACNQYELYEKDFKLARDLSHNAHRLSVEWARIEPEEGKFNEQEIYHYKKVLQSLKSNNLKVMLTLWHFTLPAWLSEIGGWENGKSIYYFKRFVEKIVPEFSEYVDFWITLNEPGVYVLQGYLLGVWPPLKKSKVSGMKVYWNLAQAHKEAYKVIHKQVGKKGEVGISNNISTYEAFHHHSVGEQVAQYLLDVVNHLFYKLTGLKSHDFLGINYYFNQYISFAVNKKLPSLVDISKTKKAVSDMGWEIYPQGMFDILVDFSDYHLPIYITENGIASGNDDRRVRFLISYLQEIYHAISAGADVRGYFYWSLIDNFEWADGFVPRFGLVEVDYKTFNRRIKPSAYVYQDIIQNNALCHNLLKLLGHGIRVEEVVKGR